MLYRTSITSIAAAITLTMTACGAWAHDESKYPDFSGQWRRVGGTQWDPGKPGGLGQQAPLTPEYQAIYEASLAAQAGGGHGSDLRWTCRTSGMPRIMTAVYPIEIIVEPTTTFILSYKQVAATPHRCSKARMCSRTVVSKSWRSTKCRYCRRE